MLLEILPWWQKHIADAGGHNKREGKYYTHSRRNFGVPALTPRI